MKKITTYILLCLLSYNGIAQNTTTELIQFGDFESWTIRNIEESALIGGDTKKAYIVGPTEIIHGRYVYPYRKTIWGCSNAYAKIMGIHKVSNTVYPEIRGDGHCARLETKVDEITVLGFVNVSILASGSLFLGQLIEPVSSSKDPYSILNMGIPFTRKPKTLLLDYKCKISPNNYVMRYNGTSSCKKIEGQHDNAEIFVLLQQRWEDANGDIYASRIASNHILINQTVENWQNNTRIPIYYGDIRNKIYYKKNMDLCPNGPFMAKNSAGEMRVIKEVSWGNKDNTPTHLILLISSGNQGAFIGTIGNRLWVDNIKFEY